MTSAVQLQNVVKRYQRGRAVIEVLSDLDLDVGAGEFLAIMGPSGSGKSTLLNLIGGLDTCDEGSVTVGGVRIDNMRDRFLTRWRGLHVGFIFQLYNLMPILDAAANVELPLMVTNLSAKQRKSNVMTALDMVGLADRAAHKPNELSGGEQQRVAIARAIVADPTLLVCDEPTGDLDRETGLEILELLRMLNQEEGKTIVMVTHNNRAANFATRRLYMEKGRLVPPRIEVPA